MAGSIFEIFDNGEGTQVAVGATGLLIVSHDNGATWNIKSSGTTEDLYGVAYCFIFDTPRWVAVGTNGTIITSSDANSWFAQSSFTTEDLYGVAFGGVFIAVGANGVLGTSWDLGVTWEEKSSGTTSDLVSITVDLSAYLIVGTNNIVLVGDITTLELSVVEYDTASLSETWDASGGSFNSTADSTVGYFYGESSWVHDALGAGTDITESGINHYELALDVLYPFDQLANPTGTANLTVTESLSIIGTALSTHIKALSGQIEWSLFEVNGSISKETMAFVEWPMFTVAGNIRREVLLDGNVLWPMFSVSGQIQGLIDPALVSTDYEVWVINSTANLHSNYTNWNANSFGTFNGEQIAAFEDGIYLLEGTKDGNALYPVMVYWAPSDFGSPAQKRVDALYLRMRGDTDDFEAVIVYDENEKRLIPVNMAGAKEGNVVKRAIAPKGLRGNTVQVGVEFTGTGTFDLFEIEAFSIPHKRRIR